MMERHGAPRGVGSGEPAGGPRRHLRQRRFLLVGVAGLAVLAAAMGVSFLDNSGTTSAAVTGGTATLVYPVANSNSVPSAVTSLKYTGTGGINVSHVFTGAVLPSWSPTALSAGSVTTAGDLVLIDATTVTTGVNLSVYITNLAGLQQDYNSFALPVNVYSSTCASGCTWSQASTVVASPPTYLTATGGFLTFNLPTGKYYDIAIDTGGSFYCTSTSTSGTAALAPSFYFTAQAY